MEQLKEALAQIHAPLALLDAKDGIETRMLGALTVQRLNLDVEIEPDLKRYACIAAHADALATAINSAVTRQRSTSAAATCKVSAPADKPGSSILHYIRAFECGDDLVIEVRSVISDAKG